jgi:hypothetical protein
MGKPDPELLPIRPLCPRCQARMLTVDVSPGPEGFDRGRAEASKLDCDVDGCRPLAGGSTAAGRLPIAAVFIFATVPCLVVKVRGPLETFPVGLSP